jgi:hypothetical protein
MNTKFLCIKWASKVVKLFPWMDEWMDGNTFLRIAYNNKKYTKSFGICFLIHFICNYQFGFLFHSPKQGFVFINKTKVNIFFSFRRWLDETIIFATNCLRLIQTLNGSKRYCLAQFC